MSSQQRRAAVTELYADAGLDPKAVALVEQSLSPRPRSMLMEEAALLGLGPGQLVLDAGCRDGRYAIPLVQRFRCRVVGVDMVDSGLERGKADTASAGVAGRISFVQGDLEALPIRSGACDMVWCRDTLEHIGDPGGFLRECGRVLRPGGGMLLHTVFATRLLEARERARLFEALTLSPAAMDRTVVERAIDAAGFEVVSDEHVGGEWVEHDLEHDEDASSVVASLLAVSRLVRARDRFLAALGPAWYERMLAFKQWRLYLILGKLETRVYRLVRGTR
jgi:sarcosine/dimethylglycine N-methyltransferase